MAFYDDPADTTEAAIRSVQGLVDHLVAVDGAYATFPGGEAKSPDEMRERIQATAEEIGVDVLFYTPADVWAGGEPEKRDRMYRMADATGADWYTILDTDFLFEYPKGVHAVVGRARRRALGYEVAKVTLVDYLLPSEGSAASACGRSRSCRCSTAPPGSRRSTSARRTSTPGARAPARTSGAARTPRRCRGPTSPTSSTCSTSGGSARRPAGAEVGLLRPPRRDAQLEPNPFIPQQLVAATAEEE
jgi:hypothetical protein